MPDASVGAAITRFDCAGRHTHVAFKLQHIFWCASIESGLNTEADQSRFIVCELKKVDAKMDLPSHDDLGGVGKSMAAAAICSVRRAREIATYLFSNKPPKVHPRICESYAVPIAMYSASVGFSDTEALSLYLKALRSISASEEIESDSEALLNEILTSQVARKGGEKKSVLHMLRDRLAADHNEELEHVGIYMEDEHYLFNRNLVMRYLLTNDWKGKRIDTLLGRLPGASRVMRRLGKSVLRFVSIPKDLVTDVEVVNNNQPSFEDQAKSDGLSF